MDWDLFYGSEPGSISVNVLCTLRNSMRSAPARRIALWAFIGPPWLKALFWAPSDGPEGKKSPAMQVMQETWVQSLGREDPLNEEMATHSSVLAWKIPWTEELGGGLPSMGSQRAGHDWADTHRLILTAFPSTCSISFWDSCIKIPSSNRGFVSFAFYISFISFSLLATGLKVIFRYAVPSYKSVVIVKYFVDYRIWYRVSLFLFF